VYSAAQAADSDRALFRLQVTPGFLLRQSLFSVGFHCFTARSHGAILTPP